MDKLRVLIADDHPLFRDGVRVLLDSMPDMEVIREATTGDEAVELTDGRSSRGQHAQAGLRKLVFD